MTIYNQKKVLITTFLIKQMHCDSSCAYCYLLKGKNINISYRYENELGQRLDKMLNFSKTYFDSPIVKICGGEIFLMENLEEYTNRLLEKYPYVLIQTNGRLLDKKNLDWIIKSKRVLLQISIDGHLRGMNRYRFRDENIMNKVLDAIAYLKANDVYTEVTSVIHKFNIEQFEDFILYLDNLPSGKLKNALKVTPLLLIDQEGIYRYPKEKIKHFESLIDNYNTYEHILPPLAYMKNYVSLLKGEKLDYFCPNSIVSITLTDDGAVKGCTNVMAIDEFNVGNIFNDNPDDIVNRYGKTKFQKLILNTDQRMPVCKQCFNFCSIYNQYFNGTITLDELCENNYMFNLPEVKVYLKEIKDGLKGDIHHDVGRI